MKKIKASFFLFFLTVFLNGSAFAAPDLYTILGVDRSSSPDQIKSAYRILAKRYHPDLNPNDAQAEAKMKEINSAWSILSDPKKRADYDQAGSFFTSEDEDRSDVVRDKIGKEYSNSKWRYEPSTGRFYDNRTQRWLIWDDLFFKFYSEEGWIFYHGEGTYYSFDLRASWDPGNKKGWYRDRINFNSDYDLPINSATGFPLDLKYEPETISDSSDLFDELFNPVNLINHKAKRENPNGNRNRSQLLERLSGLAWTEEQKADYIERAYAHFNILNHKEMQNVSALDNYAATFMEAILDIPHTREEPEIVVSFLREFPKFHIPFVEKLLLQENWFHHPNAPKWFKEIFKYQYPTQKFIQTIFSSDKKMKQGLGQLKIALPFMSKTGLNSKAMHTLINHITQYGEEGLEAFKDRLFEMVKTAGFRVLIAQVLPENSQYLLDFLRWYKKYDAQTADVFQRTLLMPYTRDRDFYIINAERSRYVFHEREYHASLRKTTQNRLDYLNARIGPSIPFFSFEKTGSSDCESVLSK